MASDKSTARAIIIAAGVATVAVVFGGQYAACDSFICDWLGAISGWVKNLIGKGREAVSEATGAEPDALELATNLIAGFEGFRSHAYKDQAGYLTIGYGHKIVPGDGFDANSVITESDARELLRQDDVVSAYNCVQAECSGIALSAQQTAALTSLCYNIGCGAFGSSTLVKLLRQGDYDGAANEFSRWVYAKGVQLPGLVARRDQEASVFLEGSQNV